MGMHLPTFEYIAAVEEEVVGSDGRGCVWVGENEVYRI
jgi:hypothetical protein